MAIPGSSAAAAGSASMAERFKEKITMFSIINETGYRFVCVRRQDETQEIKEENNFKYDVQVDSNEEDFAHTFNREIYLDIFFEDSHGIQHVIKSVKLNR